MMQSAFAGSTENILGGVRTTNYTGIICKADQVTGHLPDRSKIEGSFSMGFDWDHLNNDGANYEALFSLQDESGAFVAIVDADSGLEKSEISRVYQVSLNSGAQTDANVFEVAFYPATRLLPNKRYTLKARWHKQPAGGTYGSFTNVPLDPSATNTQSYLHFTNTVSNDAATNALAVVTLNSWSRPWMISGSATQGAFQFLANVTVIRYDRFNDSNTALNVPVRMQVSLKDSGGTTVWTSPTAVNTTISVDSYTGSNTPAVSPAIGNLSVPINLAVPVGVLTSGQSYTPVVVVTHDDGAGYIADGTAVLAGHRLMPLSGNIYFGSTLATIDELYIDPTTSANFNASPLPTANFAILDGHGFISGVADAKFSITPLPVQLQPNGDAIVSDDNLEVNVQVPSVVTANGVSMSRTGVTIRTTGLKAAEVTAQLPRGMSYSKTAGTRVLKTKLKATNVPLQSNGVPAQLGASNAGSPIAVVLERLPLVFSASGIQLDTSTGNFTFTPTAAFFDSFAELGVLENYSATNQLDWPSDKPLHMGNDQVFRFAKVSGTDQFTVSAAADGSAFVKDARLRFDAGAWFTHFPYSWLVSLGGIVSPSKFVIHDNVVTADSALAGTIAIAGNYEPDPPSDSSQQACPAGQPQSGVKHLYALADNDFLPFAPDGSLLGGVRLTEVVNNAPVPVNKLSWGTFETTPTPLYAHELSYSGVDGIRATIMLPSHFLPFRDVGVQNWVENGTVQGLSEANRTAASLLIGRATSGAGFEYPQTDGYSNGTASYAGVNVSSDPRIVGPRLSGISRLGGGDPMNYTLATGSRFYFRGGGASGVLQSTDNLDSIVNDMTMHFDGMKLGFLDNTVHGSHLDGTLKVGSSGLESASEVNLAFEGLTLHANGALDRADLKGDQAPQHLRYWNVDILPLAMQFIQPDACSGPKDAILGLSVETSLPVLPGTQKLRGLLGFRGIDGSLVAKDDKDSGGVDSRFKMPGSIKIAGPGSSSYTMSPVCGAYLNKWPGTNSSGLGFTSLAGLVSVPFFDALPAHLHAVKGAAPNPLIYLMGPQITGDSGAFSKAYFDPLNLAAPPGVSVDTYRTSAAYGLHAHRNWMGLLDLNYVTNWNSGNRSFRSLADQTTDLKIISASSKVRSITPSTADISFKAKVNNSMGLSATQLMGDALNAVGADSVLSVIDTKISSLPGSPSFSSITTKLNDFEKLLADGPAYLIRPPLINAIKDVLPANDPQASSAAFIAALKTNLLAKFDGAPSAPNLPSAGWKDEVSSGLDKAHDLVAQLKSISNHADDVLKAANAAAAFFGNNQIGDMPASAAETLTQVNDSLNVVDARITQVRSAVSGLSLNISDAGWQSLLANIIPELPNLPLSGLSLDDQAGLIADALLKYLLGDAKICLISEDMREQASALSDDIHGATDSILGTMNDIISQASSSTDPYGLPGLKTGKLEGYARINGDSLHELRLDLDVELDTGSSPKFHGYALYRDLSSDTPLSGCRDSAGIAAELTLGAETQFQFGAPASPVRLEVEAKFAFANDGGLNGLSGRFGIAGDGFKLGVMTITQAELGFSFGGGAGGVDYYLYGKGAGKSEYADVEAAFYFGVACDVTGVLGRIDQHVTDLLSQPNLSGVLGPANGNPNPTYGFYAFGYGAVSVNSLLGIPPSCMLNIKAGLGAGGFGFFRKQASGEALDLVVGIRNDISLSGEALCLADVSARLSVVGAGSITGVDLDHLDSIPSQMVNAELFGSGEAEVSAEIGISPFSYDFTKTMTINFSYASPGAGQARKLSWDLDL